MLRRILVANRGEIAARILRACREMNIETVAVFSEADRGALFTTLATQALCIGPASSHASYLRGQTIIDAATFTACDAIHPGFGFLSENADFAREVEQAGLVFIGPPPEVIECMGDKAAARAQMMAIGVPVIPGSEGVLESPEVAGRLAEQIGFPVLIKARAGGGGRGMRVVEAAQELDAAYAEAAAEAEAAFGDSSLYLEKYIASARHIEVQIMADSHGTCLSLGERDCTLQRNHQKVMEEAPAQALDAPTRAQLCADALKAARSVGYVNAGTVEFLLDASGKHYFIEMNTRIQVEHPVTEMVTGVNIVREQIRIASGLSLDIEFSDVTMTGHAIECRINAEDPFNGFAPSPGRIEQLHLPSGFGVRVDTVIHPGYLVSPFYDSMIAKIITHGATRTEAILRMRRALEETVITGIKTNIGLLYMLLYEPDVLNNRLDTHSLETIIARLQALGEQEMMLK